MDKLPSHFRKRRDKLIWEIQAAFAGISLEGGVSWAEAQLRSKQVNTEERARESDRTISWQDRLADPDWNNSGGPEWCFLDDTGFAFYLPAGMIRTVLAAADQGVQLVLSMKDRALYREGTPSALNLRQAQAVKTFLLYMSSLEHHRGWHPLFAEDWDTTLAVGWNQVENRVDPELAEEKVALIEEIYAAFEGVNRQNGVSWSESRVIDDYGSDKERKLARERDLESSWQALVDPDRWSAETHIGGWAFLDAIGARYYLPAAMVRIISEGYDNGLRFFITYRPELGDSFEQWSALDSRQKKTVGRFLRYMIAVAEETGDESEDAGWEETLRSYWE